MFSINRAVFSLLFFALTIGIYWLGGGNFERGFGLAFTVFVAVGLLVVGYWVGVEADSIQEKRTQERVRSTLRRSS
jgi:4-hydroxybenzoate polyprenyltransferase